MFAQSVAFFLQKQGVPVISVTENVVRLDDDHHVFIGRGYFVFVKELSDGIQTRGDARATLPEIVRDYQRALVKAPKKEEVKPSGSVNDPSTWKIL